MAFPGSTQPAPPTGSLRLPFKPLGGKKALLICTAAAAASTVFSTYAHLTNIPEQSASGGIAVGLLPQGCNVALQFVHNAASANNTTSTVRVLLGYEVGDGEIEFVPALDLALTAGNASVATGSDLVGTVATELKYVDTISKTADYLGTPGANVFGEAADGIASIEFDARGASYVMVLTSKGTADGVAVMGRGF